MKSRMIRAICAILAALCLALPHTALAEDLLAPTPVPQRSDDGLIRVKLSSLGTPQTVHLSLDGTYSVENDAGFRFADGAELTLTAADDCIYLVLESLTLALGGEVTLTRHANEDGSLGAIYISEAGGNAYPGDLTLRAAGDALDMRLTLPVEEYLNGVVAYEMSDSFPMEALKAQAVAARTYAMCRKAANANRDYDLVDTPADQVYKGTNPEFINVDNAISATKGIVGYYHDKPAVCYFTASNGGQTALATDIWGGEGDYGYLAITDDPYDLENPRSLVNGVEIYSDYIENSAEVRELLNGNLATALQGFDMTGVTSTSIERITSVDCGDPRFENTRQYETLTVTCEVTAEKKLRLLMPKEPAPEWMRKLVPEEALEEYVSWPIRMLLSPVEIDLNAYDDVKDGLKLGLNKADYEMMSVSEGESSWRVEFRRFGHGVGMSQRGAQWMAGHYGKGYEEILSFYYPGLSFEPTMWTYQPAKIDDTVVKLLRARGITGVAAQLPELAEGEKYARVKLSAAGSTLNLRANPSTEANILASLMNRTRLIVSEQRDDGWSHVHTATLDGYVKTEYLEFE